MHLPVLPHLWYVYGLAAIMLLTYAADDDVDSNAESELKAAFKIHKPVFAIQTTPDTDMHDIETFYGLKYNGVKYYDVTRGFERSMDELVRDMKANYIM